MNKTTTFRTTNLIDFILIHALVAMALTTYLAYIDEGAYNFNWMKDAGNWIMFFIYVAIFTGFQLLVKFLLSKVYQGKFLTIWTFCVCFLLPLLILSLFKT